MVSELSKSISALRKAYTEGKAKVTITKKDSGETKEYIRTSGGGSSSNRATVQETQESKINRAVQQYAKTGVADTTGLSREEAQTVIRKAIPLRGQELSNERQTSPIVESPSNIETLQQQKDRLRKFNVPVREDYTVPPPPTPITTPKKEDKPVYYLQTQEAPKILGIKVPGQVRQAVSDFGAGFQEPRETLGGGFAQIGKVSKVATLPAGIATTVFTAPYISSFKGGLNVVGKLGFSAGQAAIGSQVGKEIPTYFKELFNPTDKGLKQLVKTPEQEARFKEFRDDVAKNIDYEKQYATDLEAFNKAKKESEGQFYTEALNLGIPAEEAQKQFNQQFNNEQIKQNLFSEFKERGYSDIKAQEFTQRILSGEESSLDQSLLGKAKRGLTSTVFNVGGALPYLEQITPNYQAARSEYANRLKDLGYTDKQIKEELKLIQARQDIESRREAGGLLGAEIFGGELTGRLLNVGGTTSKLKTVLGLSFAGALEGGSAYFVQSDTRKQEATLGGAATSAALGGVFASLIGYPAIKGTGVKKVAARGFGYLVDAPLEFIGDILTEGGSKVLGVGGGKGARVFTPTFTTAAATEQFNFNSLQQFNPTPTISTTPTNIFTPTATPTISTTPTQTPSFEITPAFSYTPEQTTTPTQTPTPADVPTFDFTPANVPTQTPTTTITSAFTPSFVPTPLWRLPPPVLPDLSGFGSGGAVRGGSKKGVSFVNELAFGLNVLQKGLGFGFGLPQNKKEAQKVFKSRTPTLNVFNQNSLAQNKNFDFNNLAFGLVKKKKKSLNKKKTKSKKSKKKKK